MTCQQNDAQQNDTHRNDIQQNDVQQNDVQQNKNKRCVTLKDKKIKRFAECRD